MFSHQSTRATAYAMKNMNEKRMEVDYALEPTLLYLLIEERDWEGVKYQAENFEREAGTWIRKVDPHTKVVRWRVLPIHAALLNGVPAHVLSALIQADPDAVKEKDDQGMLPIHISIKKHVEPAVINLLITAYPASVDVACDNLDKTPVEMAKASSSVHKNYYLRALKKGGALHSTIVTDPFSDLLCGIDYKSVMKRSPFVLLRASQ